ncbi:MAG: group III truncated hemoglobin [Pseudomonadota bacterium]|jgi:hemoglobin|nr:group III truncated hemoglobin [Pseudomonadota bacterium]
MTFRVRSAEDRRAEIQARAAAMGIDEDFISTLVERFYGRVRADERLGPIFDGAIEDWDDHLPKMKAFWSSVALNSGRYSGKPVPVHQNLSGVEEADFAVWLGLFEDTVSDLAPSPDVTSYFMERAQRIAESLKLAMFSLPSLKRSPSV